MSLPPYQYEPLQGPDSVRVLVLKPSPDFAAELECDIIQYSRLDSLCSLDTTTQYSAVSYAWGEPVFTHHVRCASTATPSRISITPNVDGMLRHLRDPANPRYLWIDAISLNQADEIEKAAQVPLMGQIYQQARTVHVWLGPDHGDANAVFAFIQSLGTVPNDSTDEPGHVAGLIQRVLGNAADRILCAFWDLPWFTRRWVLQEVLLAQQAVVHYGREQLPWLGLTMAMSKLEAAAANRSVGVTMHPSVTALGTLSKIKQGSSHLLELIWEFHDWQCSDPRDRIFALHGLCRREGTGSLPAYTLSWTDAYTSYAKTCLDAGHQEFILLHLAAFGSLNHRDARLPSWVPDWSLTKKSHPLLSQSNFIESRLEGYRPAPRKMPPEYERPLANRPQYGRTPANGGQCIFTTRRGGDVVRTMLQGTSWEHSRRLFHSFCDFNHRLKIHDRWVTWVQHGLLQFLKLMAAEDNELKDIPDKLLDDIIKSLNRHTPLLLPAGRLEGKLFRRIHDSLSECALVVTDHGLLGFTSPILSDWDGLEVLDTYSTVISSHHDFQGRWRLCIVVSKQQLNHPPVQIRGIFQCAEITTYGSSRREITVS